jgi:hypothetical protein
MFSLANEMDMAIFKHTVTNAASEGLSFFAEDKPREEVSGHVH